MSRIGKLPVIVPEKVKAFVTENCVRIEGSKGTLERCFNSSVTITLKENAIHVTPNGTSKLARAMHGTARAIIANMVKGVLDGYSKSLEIQGTGFKAILKGQVLDLALGYSHPILYSIPPGIHVTVADGTKIKVEGADKHLVGQVAADIKHYYPVEPYKGKGVREVGQFVRRKEGKKSA
jgi:large subunit ribosomal protein L6